MKLPDLYFRIRENGAAVFRVRTDRQTARLDLQQVAVVNVKNGDIKAQDTLSDTEQSQIEDWLSNRQNVQSARDLDDIHRAVDQINILAQWAQSKATDEQLEDITDALLLSIHDLRSVLVRKKADRLNKG